MKAYSLESLLLVGLDLVGLAESAKNAGFRVYAADYFGDYDLIKLCDGYKAVIKQKAGKSCGKIEKNFSPEIFVELVKEILRETPADALLLSSGLDDSFDVVEELNELVPILGNKPEVFRKVRDKYLFFEELKRLNLTFPETVVVESFQDALKAAKDIGYPVVVKPSKGFAGISIRKAENPEELEKSFRMSSLFDTEGIVQKYIDGTHASVSILSSGDEVKILTVNEQLLGIREIGQAKPFGFCGNIVPLDVSTKTLRKCVEIARKITLHFGLLGSNGIDFVLSSEGIPYVMEVNPRFQATIKCVERFLGLNLVKMHVEACLNSHLLKIPRKDDKYCVRLLLYSKSRAKVGDLRGLNWVRNIPFPGVIIEEGEPLCSVIAEAKERKKAFKKALNRAKLIYGNMTEPV